MKKEHKQKNHDAIRELVKSYGSSSDNHFSIAIIDLEKINAKSKTGTIIKDLVIAGIAGGLSAGMVSVGPSDWSNETDTTIITANQECLAFYVLKEVGIYTDKNVKKAFVIMHKNISNIRFSWYFGHGVKLLIEHEGKELIIKFSTPTIATGVYRQKEEVKKLLTQLKKLKEEIKQKVFLDKDNKSNLSRQQLAEAGQDATPPKKSLSELATEAEAENENKPKESNPWDKYN